MKKNILIPLSLLLIALAAWRFGRKEPFLYAGTLEATEVDLAPRFSAVISSVTVQEGDAVRTGQPLVVLDGADLRLAADLAERDFRRAETLRRSGSLPEENLERLRFRRDDAALRLSWCVLASPLDGTVLHRYHEPGELAGPAQKILTLADLREVWAMVYVPAPLMARLSIGQRVTGLLPELNRRVEGRIVRVRDEAEFTPKNVQTRSERERLVYGVKVLFPNADRGMKPGMSVEVDLTSAPR